MKSDFPESYLDFISLYQLISKLLWVKFKKISYLTSFIYLTAISKLKPEILKIKPISTEHFEEVLQNNNYEINILGDINSCTLVSLNTLIALSVRNKSWLKVKKLNVKGNKKTCSQNWIIQMPSVKFNEKSEKSSYLIQCIAVSGELQDFVLYVTYEKLFNMSHHWSESNSYCDLEDRIVIDSTVTNYSPELSECVVVAPITCPCDLGTKHYEEILDEYFKKPKYLKVNEVFQVKSQIFEKELKANFALNGLDSISFKVISLTGESGRQEYLVLKGYTSIYLNPTVHGYIPQSYTNFIKTHDNISGFETPLCAWGLSKCYEKLRKQFKVFLKKPNVEFRASISLLGAVGSGKKDLAKAVASSFGLHFLQVNCFDFYGQNPSVFQAKLDIIFSKARRTVPCVVYLDNVELLGRQQNYIENPRLIHVFMTHIKELWNRKPNSYPLFIIGAINSKQTEVLPSISRLFMGSITIPPNQFEETFQILKWAVMKNNMICSNAILTKVAEKVKSYVFEDLKLLVKHAIRFQSESGGGREIKKEHFDKGIDVMEAAYSDSIGAARVPTVYWDDIGGLSDLKKEIMLTLNLPLKHSGIFSSGLKRSGIMFYGPPGTGKTLMAKAVATECNYNFLSVKGPELMNMYVGQSEKNVRDVFERARAASPCIIFFDELDSLAPSRGKSGDSGGVTDRVVSQLLAEMDGLNINKDVFVIAATNRPDLVDSALLRPGRFDKMFYVGVCDDKKSKLSVLKALTRRFELDSNVNFEDVIQQLPNQVTGADLYSVCSNAWFSAARRAVSATEEGVEVLLPLKVYPEDFSEAIEQFVPSITLEDMKYYNSLRSSNNGE